MKPFPTSAATKVDREVRLDKIRSSILANWPFITVCLPDRAGGSDAPEFVKKTDKTF